MSDFDFVKEKVRRYSIPFQEYIDLEKRPSLDCSKNSLEQGLVIATEIALGLKKQRRSEKVCFITGDGAL